TAPEAPTAPPAAPAPVNPPVVAAGDTLAPTISAVAIGRRWRVGAKLTPAKRGRLATGATLRFRLSEAARTTVTISQPATGRRVSGRCQRVTKATRGQAKCRIANVRTTLRASGKAGVNTIRITGKIGRKTLKPGPYVVTVSAIDAAGNRAAPKTARFTISR
ncbi:MAG: hypothetical protein JHC84_22255, partial [Solirubrobacteraceae bacterium]|nr:hypothetical protein [Solirubrobacteraceae bacterium]